ncbi:MAG: class I SAM-dependent methyltransferase [Candidatus Eisenbacteria bacterium]
MDPLADLNPTGRFTDRVEDYVRYRPGYPAAAVDHVLEGLAPGATVVDVGAGTGIWTVLLAARRRPVIALEPNAAMRAAALARAGVSWRAGAAEDTGLADASASLITVAQAFHWFRAAEALREFARVLAPGGRLALVWNRRRKDDAFTAGYRDAITSVSGESAAETMTFDPAVIPASGRFAPADRIVFEHAQELDRAGRHGRARSASYVPKHGPRAEELGARLDTLFDVHGDANGRVRLLYECEVWRTTRP